MKKHSGALSELILLQVYKLQHCCIDERKKMCKHYKNAKKKSVFLAIKYEACINNVCARFMMNAFTLLAHFYETPFLIGFDSYKGLWLGVKVINYRWIVGESWEVCWILLSILSSTAEKIPSSKTTLKFPSS